MNGGNPWGSVPTRLDPVVGQVEGDRRDDGCHDHDQYGWDLGQPPLQYEDERDPAIPTAADAATASPLARPFTKPRTS